jgi:predicted nucleic acid-binding protein
MEWVKRLYGQVVAIDTAPLIYFIEQHPGYIERVRPFFASLAEGRFRAVTSTVTLLEVLVRPLRQGDDALAHQYNDILLSSPSIAALPVTYATAQEAAELRARHGLKTPDAIQLAVALHEGAAALLTNDRDLPRLPGIEILRLREMTA